MISFEQAWEDQKDLAKLCREDIPRNSAEIFAPNDYYGHAGVMKDYMGVAWDRPLKAVIQHGVVLGQKFLWQREVESVLSAIYCWQRNIEGTYARSGKRIISGSAPMMHAMKAMDYKPREDRRGTIFFAAHSTQHIASIFDRARLARRLMELPEKYQPVTVCIYWRDYELGHAKPYFDLGMQVVSAGGMWDREFCYRWLHLASMHRYAATNDIGSSLFYALAAGLPVLYFGEDKPELQADNEEDSRYVKDDRPVEVFQAIREMFNEASDEPTRQQIELVNSYVGMTNLRSPEALREVLL
jgi:hypothetical protein